MLESPQSYCISINGSVLSLSQNPQPLSRFFSKEGQRFVVKEVDDECCLDVIVRDC